MTMMKKILAFFLVVVSLSTFAQDPNFHIYLCFGQSNMEGTGTIEAQDKLANVRVKVFQNQTCSNLNRTYATWYTAIPPLNRCWGKLGPADYFGKTMADAMPSNVTIGLVNTSVGGCDIAFFQKSAPLGKASTKGGGTADIPTQFTGGYAWMLDLAKKAQKTGVIKGIIFHQGETNTGDATWKTKVNEIVTNLRADLGIGNVPFLSGELLYTNNGSGTTSCCASHNIEVNKIPSVVANSYVISASGLPGATGDVAHFSSASYRTLGIRYAQKMLTLVNNNPIPNVSITAPTNNTAICFESSVTISATASVSSGSISKVDFYDGNTLLGSDNSIPFSYAWNKPSLGTHTIRAISTSAANVASVAATSTFTVNASPVITFTAPANNSTIAASPITLSASVVGTNITNVQFYNGNTLLGSDATSPYSYQWANAANGTYTLYAKATNSSTCTDTATVKTTVSLVTGLEGNVLLNEVDCFPNPFAQSFTIKAPDKFDYFIFNLNGIEVGRGADENTVPVGQNLPVGMYLVKVQSDSKSKLFKINKF
jgi:Carbohydrate esterase, sialic acid-specific acetylesterase/Bacterial Ig domain